MQLVKRNSYLQNIILIISVTLSMVSCSDKTVFDKYKNMEDSRWHKDSIINFSFNSIDTISKNNIYINLRNNKDYEFSNLFLIVGIQFPNNYQIVDTLEYEMTAPNGNFLGTGITDIKENKLEYKTNVVFPYKGDYNIHVQHAMRKSRKVEGLIYLNGITDIGLQIEKAN